MKVAFLSQANHPLEIREFPIPKAKKGEAVIKVQYAALNHRDLWTVLGQYRGLSQNLVLGSDCSGTVYELGEEVSDLELGQAVIVNPSLHWGDSEKVQGKDFQILGNPDPGTFSEFVLVPAENVFPKPHHLSMEEAAALPLAGLTAFRALFTKGQLKIGDKVLITGIGGGAAQMALQMALAFGTDTYISSSHSHKINHAVEMGARGGFLYNSENWVPDVLNQVPEGFDLIIDSAGGKTFSDLIELCSPGGKLVFFGGTAGSIGPLVPAKVFRRQLSILGTTMGSPREFASMIQYYEEKKIKPVLDSIFPLEEINQALEKMKSGRQTGKILIKINP